MTSDMQKRCLHLGQMLVRGHNSGARTRLDGLGTYSNPHENRLEPHRAVNGRGAAYRKRIASLCTGPGVGFREGSNSFNHTK